MINTDNIYFCFLILAVDLVTETDQATEELIKKRISEYFPSHR